MRLEFLVEMLTKVVKVILTFHIQKSGYEARGVVQKLDIDINPPLRSEGADALLYFEQKICLHL